MVEVSPFKDRFDSRYQQMSVDVSFTYRLDPTDAADIGKLDREAIARVREEAWPDAGCADELHDALMWLTFMTAGECAGNAAWPTLMQELSAAGRVIKVTLDSGVTLWTATERTLLA